ncbi:MAG: YbaB/EbfC family nucleoid-associated protein [Segniliparus sp.]|uniref:YbaB/EbfC family nucleoid-associated protein n=1 Tax=Segniliparus sp. TaxID=2804064 RepID=UPI003F34B4CA
MTDPDEQDRQQLEHLSELRRKATALQTAIAALDVRASSAKGEVGVNVDAQGRVTDIRLSPQALQLGETSLANLLLQTIQEARDTASRRAQEIAKPFTSDPGIAAALDAVRELTQNT